MNELQKASALYTDFHIAGKKIHIPYFRADRTTRHKNFAGKGTVSQIQKALINTARRQNFSLSSKTASEIQKFMFRNNIGVDCSGFVYNVLDLLLQNTQHISLDKIIKRYAGIWGKLDNLIWRWRQIRRTSAATLTSELNSVKIKRVCDMRIGDLLRLSPENMAGSHVAIITNISAHYIAYAHSSELTEIEGPHYQKIRIIDSHAGVGQQIWLEKSKTGENYGDYAFHPDLGDGVCRLKYLATY